MKFNRKFKPEIYKRKVQKQPENPKSEMRKTIGNATGNL